MTLLDKNPNLEVYKIIGDDNFDDDKGVIVKLPRPVELKGGTNEKFLVEPIYVLGFKSATSSKVNFVYDHALFNTPRFNHYNIEPNFSSRTIILDQKVILGDTVYKKGDKIRIKTSHFCNPVYQSELYSDPELYAQMIAMQLEEPNPSNAYGTSTNMVENFVSPLGEDRVIKCSRCGNIIKNSSSDLSKVISVCDTCLGQDLSNLTNTLSNVQSTGYYAKRKNTGDYRHLKNKPRKSESYSEYYPIINANSFNNLDDFIPVKDFDVLLLGCGSAGTSIVEQLARTKMAKSYKLIDFDTVEAKNLRNQTYTREDIGLTKVNALGSKLKILTKENLNIEINNSKFQDVNLKYYKFKYAVLAFDSIDTRIKAFNDIKEGKIKAEYIIDTRYKDLDCSIYFIDTQDENQMRYYEMSLLSDKAELDKIKARIKEQVIAEDKVNPQWTKSRIIAYWGKHNGFTSNCSVCKRMIGIDGTICGSSCRSSACVEGLYNSIKNNIEEVAQPMAVDPSLVNTALTQSDINDLASNNSCYHYNIIDIYKFSSSFITCAIRNIYGDKPKGFTHVETTTNGLPKSLVIME